MTYNDFLNTVTENEGKVLATAGGRASFSVSKSADAVFFVPTSSGDPRRLNAKGIQACIDLFNITESTTTSDYTEMMRDSSYVLAIIKLWLKRHANTPHRDNLA
jgi:hypothetical protein